ncbi:hypothetical protein [Brachybacterium vulturis]|uniref:hypothetical protein n=1 Tax=Brachybacterium vulturis TaxID=2017484 RepID=UPI0037365019
MSAPDVESPSAAHERDRVAQLYRRWARESAQGLSSLAPAMAGAEIAVSPQLARSAQATENVWREIEDEFGLFTSTEAAERMGYGGNRAWASAQRRAGKLVGVRRGGAYRYPAFQLDPEVMPLIAELVALAREHDWSDESVVLWLCSPSGWMPEGRRPVEFLREDADAVRASAELAMAPQW